MGMAKNTGQVCYGKFCLEVEVADTFLKKALGLMFRSKLGENKGILFLSRKERIIPIWMLFTRIPLDVIWINAEKRIVHIERNLKPCRGLLCSPVYPKKPAKYVLEVNAGISNKLEMREESVIDITD